MVQLVLHSQTACVYPEQSMHSDTGPFPSWKRSGYARLASDVRNGPCTTGATGNCKNARCFFKCVYQQV